jgi:hypothetical protein
VGTAANHINLFNRRATPPNPDAVAFLTYTGITTPSIVDAVNYAVNFAQTNNLWGSILGAYPAVGNNSFKAGANLKNPGVLSLNYFGGFTFDDYGILSPMGNGYVEIDLTGGTNIFGNNYGIGMKLETDSPSAAVVMGTGAACHIFQKFFVDNNAYFRGIGAGVDNYSMVGRSTKQLYRMYGKAANSAAFIGNTKVVTGTSGSLDAAKIRFFGNVLGGAYTTTKGNWLFVTTALTDAQDSAMHTMISTFNTMIGRV